MRLKHWLLLSYLVVMFLPLSVAYFLFAWINAYHNDLNVKEYVQKSLELQDIVSVLDSPELYQPDTDWTQVEELASSRVSIVLYNQDGVVLFTSDPFAVPLHSILGREILYKDLYSIEQGYRAYRYKQPVFDSGEPVGFFDVQLSRDEWVTGVGQRTWWAIIIFAFIFISMYLIVVMLVNRKLNRRLTRLMRQMTAFAQGGPVLQHREGKDEIGQLSDHFYKMKTEIDSARAKIEREQQKKQLLIASLSHDLKTPLTSIHACAEMLGI